MRVGNEPNWRRIHFEHETSIPKKDLEEYIGTSEHYKKYGQLEELYHIASEFTLNVNRILSIQKYGI